VTSEAARWLSHWLSGVLQGLKAVIRGCFAYRTRIRSRPTVPVDGCFRWKSSPLNRWRTALNRLGSGADCRALSRSGGGALERQTTRTAEAFAAALVACERYRLGEAPADEPGAVARKPTALG